jgi:hypothetical protein
MAFRAQFVHVFLMQEQAYPPTAMAIVLPIRLSGVR